MAEDELVMVYELRLCSNGSYYVYYNNELLTDEKGNYITFSKFEKESADYILGLLNMYYSIANNKNKSSSQDNFDLSKIICKSHPPESCSDEELDWIINNTMHFWNIDHCIERNSRMRGEDKKL